MNWGIVLILGFVVFMILLAYSLCQTAKMTETEEENLDSV